MIREALIVVSVAMLAACASTSTGVVSTGEDTYMLARQDPMAHYGSEVKAKLYKEGAAFCTSKGKKFQQITSSSQDAVIYRVHAGAEIQFACK